ncbi:MAG: L-seryl-tRNA(Sec) selenium transferase [Acidobacteriales bacterium]|nr:L-seryl-tRNA(Sec) selenium transferase [Terriglobales bacterium]
MDSAAKADLYRKLPSVDELLRNTELSPLIRQFGIAAVTEAARTVIRHLRQDIASAASACDVGDAVQCLHVAVESELHHSLRSSLRAVINATGVILHTNLGRAPLAVAALEHINQTAGSYSNLEFDLHTGERGSRDAHVGRLFQQLFSSGNAPAALSTIVVNNNAAAVLLALNTVAQNGEVIVSRGELVEIGGSFRIPEIMEKSGAILREVGTTNRTHISDYENAVNQNTRALLRVHRSNFEITGFAGQPEITALAALAKRHQLPLIEDLGSGALFDLDSVGSNEPGITDSLRAGVDLVTYSGDKLLGGPQAGMLTGRDALIARMRSNPLFRALRVDKLTYAALEATLLAYLKGHHDSIPALRMLRLPKKQIRDRAEALIKKTQSEHLSMEVVEGQSLIGGGAAPASALPTYLVAIKSDSRSGDALVTMLRACDPPVIARVETGHLVLDLRTVFPEQDEMLARFIATLDD